jgi:hypothetical protein
LLVIIRFSSCMAAGSRKPQALLVGTEYARINVLDNGKDLRVVSLDTVGHYFIRHSS